MAMNVFAHGNASFSFGPRVRAGPPPPGRSGIPIPMDVDVNHNFHRPGPRVPGPMRQFNAPRKDWIAGSDGHPRCHVPLGIMQNVNSGQAQFNQYSSGRDPSRVAHASYSMLPSDFRLHATSLHFIRSEQVESKFAPSFYDALSLSALNYWLHTDGGMDMYNPGAVDPQNPGSSLGKEARMRLRDEIPYYGMLVSEHTDHRAGRVLAMAFAISHMTNAMPNIWLGANYYSDDNRPYGDEFGLYSYLWLRIVERTDEFAQRKYLRIEPFCTNNRTLDLGDDDDDADYKNMNTRVLSDGTSPTAYSIYVGRAISGSGDGRIGARHGNPNQAHACASLHEALYPTQPTKEYQATMNTLPRVEVMLGSFLGD